MFAAACSGLGGTQLKILENVIFVDGVLVCLLVVTQLFPVEVLDLPSEFVEPLLLRNFETSRKAASFFIQKCGSSFKTGFFLSILLSCTNLWNFVLRVKGSDSHSRKGHANSLATHYRWEKGQMRMSHLQKLSLIFELSNSYNFKLYK